MKIIFLAVAATICFCIGCNNENKSGMSSTAQKNLDAAHAINKAIETGDVSKLGNYIAADAIEHTDQGDLKGIDTIKSFLGSVHKMGTDMKYITIKELADDDYVFQWMHFTGVNTNAAMGPLGKFDMNAVEVSKYKDGKSTEHWEFVQPADMMKMMASMTPEQVGAMTPKPKDEKMNDTIQPKK